MFGFYNKGNKKPAQKIDKFEQSKHHKNQVKIHLNNSDSSSGFSIDDDYDDDDEDETDSDENENVNDNDDEEDEGYQTLTRRTHLLNRMKRSSSSFGKLSMLASQQEKISKIHLRPKTSNNSKTPESSFTSGSFSPKPSLIQRPNTTVAFVRKWSFKPAQPQKQIRKKFNDEKKKESQTNEQEEVSLAVLIDRFLKNTPKSVETAHSGGNNKFAQEREARLKSQICQEKANSIKKDLRYFDLVNCLSENKL